MVILQKRPTLIPAVANIQGTHRASFWTLRRTFLHDWHKAFSLLRWRVYLFILPPFLTWKHKCKHEVCFLFDTCGGKTSIGHSFSVGVALSVAFFFYLLLFFLLLRTRRAPRIYISSSLLDISLTLIIILGKCPSNRNVLRWWVQLVDWFLWWMLLGGLKRRTFL